MAVMESPEDALIRKQTVGRALAAMKSREFAIIWRYICCGETLSSMAHLEGVSPARIVQLKNSGLSKARRALQRYG